MMTKRYGTAVFFGAFAFLLWRLAEMLFMQDADGYCAEWTRPLRPVPVVLLAALLLALWLFSKNECCAAPCRVIAAAFAAGSVAVLSATAYSLLTTGYERPFAAAFERVYGALAQVAQTNLRFTLVLALLSLPAAAFLLLAALTLAGRKRPRGLPFLAGACIVWLWLRVLASYVSAPVNPFDAEGLMDMLCLLLCGLAFSSSFSSGERRFARAAGGLCFAYAAGSLPVTLVFFVFERRAAGEIIALVCNLLLAVCALLVPTAVNKIFGGNPNDEPKNS